MDTKFFTQMCLRHIWVKNLVFIFFLIIQKKYGKAPLSTAVHLLEDVSPLTGSAVSRKPTTVVPVRKPRNAPHAACSAAFFSCPLISSPTNAPTNGQNITPNNPEGPKGSPMIEIIRPMLQPVTPALLPPCRLVLSDGTT